MAKTLSEHNFFDFDATVVAKSKNKFSGDILTTMVVTLPRYVLAELNTHRMFSRNSASSRAIPFKTMIHRTLVNTFVPVAWQKDHKGMQGTEYFTDPQEIDDRRRLWLGASGDACVRAQKLHDREVTKQLVNRLLEPFLWHTVIITASEWENFFNLRCPVYRVDVNEPNTRGTEIFHSRKEACEKYPKLESNTLLDWLKINQSQADIHISLAAEAMWDAYNEAEIRELEAGEWHIPFRDEIGDFPTELVKREQEISTGLNQTIEDIKIKIAVATCARISYGNISPATSNYEADLKLYDQLTKNGHASPLEHVAKCMSEEEYYSYYKGTRPIGEASHGYFAYELYITDSGEYDTTIISKQHDLNKCGWCDNFRGFISERHLKQV